MDTIINYISAYSMHFIEPSNWCAKLLLMLFWQIPNSIFQFLNIFVKSKSLHQFPGLQRNKHEVGVCVWSHTLYYQAWLTQSYHITHNISRKLLALGFCIWWSAMVSYIELLPVQKYCTSSVFCFEAMIYSIIIFLKMEDGMIVTWGHVGQHSAKWHG